MKAHEIDSAASRLLAAYGDEPVRPVIEDHPRATISDAYRIQQRQVETWGGSGELVRGHKVGLASVAVQRQMGVDQPDFGHLTASMFHLEHQPVPASTFIQPRVEPEIAFVLGRRLEGPGVTSADAVRAVDYVVPALEIVDSRIRDWQISIVDTIADNASSGGVFLGSTPSRLFDVDLRLSGCLLHLNGDGAATGAGGAVLGSPLNALVWLANTVGPLGVALEPGHVVLPGAMTRAVPIAAGDCATASIAGIGSVTAVLSKGEAR